jgi:hypothetical protein
MIGCGERDSNEILQFARDDQLDLLADTSKPRPWTHLELNNDPKNFQFVIVTDRNGGNRPGVFEQGIEKVNLLQPEFVLSVGDLINGYTDDPLQVKNEWDEFDTFVAELDMPFFYVPGNHDITNKMMEDMWNERFGSTFYYFVYRNVLFLCLNSEEALTAHESTVFSEQQINFIKQTLETHPDVRWTLLFFHKPVWMVEEYVENGKQALKKSGWNEIESLLKNRKYTVFAGHIHRYTHSIRQQRDYITLATMGGGSRLGGPVFGQFDHVMWVTMTDDGPIMANLMLDGIWDKEFNAEDIEKNLYLLIHGKAVTTETRFNDDKPLVSQLVEMRLTNLRDLPMEVSLKLDKGEHISFSPEKITQTIQPNSVGSLKVQLKIKNPDVWTDQSSGNKEEESWERMWNELRELQVRWEVTYNFEKYGKILVKGSKDVY